MTQIYPNFTTPGARSETAPVAAPIQTKRVAFAGTGSSQNVDLVWDVPFADTNYTVVYSIEVTAGNQITAQGVLVNKTASGFTIDGITGIAFYQYVLHAVAFHD